MPEALPSLKGLEDAGLKAKTLRAAEIRGLDVAARRMGGDLALEGRMAWSETALGWIADWRLVSAGKAHEWRTRTATFDEAFRSAIGGAAQVLSGHGEPRWSRSCRCLDAETVNPKNLGSHCLYRPSGRQPSILCSIAKIDDPIDPAYSGSKRKQGQTPAMRHIQT